MFIKSNKNKRKEKYNQVIYKVCCYNHDLTPNLIIKFTQKKCTLCQARDILKRNRTLPN